MEVYIGLDVSLASTAVCVLGEKGKIVTEAQVASTPEALVGFIGMLPHEIAAIGLKAGPLSHWLYKGMTDAGFEVALMETGPIRRKISWARSPKSSDAGLRKAFYQAATAGNEEVEYERTGFDTVYFDLKHRSTVFQFLARRNSS